MTEELAAWRKWTGEVIGSLDLQHLPIADICFRCGEPSTKRCDGKIVQGLYREALTCNRPLCDKCVTYSNANESGDFPCEGSTKKSDQPFQGDGVNSYSDRGDG